MSYQRHPDFWFPHRKPIGRVEVNPDHPLSGHLVAAVLFQQGQAIDLVSGFRPAIAGTPEPVTSDRGLAYNFVAGSSETLTWEIVNRTGFGAHQASVVVCCRPRATLTGDHIAADLGRTANQRSLAAGIDANGFAFCAIDSNNGKRKHQTGSTDWTDRWVVIGVQNGVANNSGQLYENGVFVGEASGGTGSNQDTSTHLRLGHFVRGGSQVVRFNGDIAWALAFSTQLSELWHAEIAARPFALFRPVHRRAFKAAGGASGQTGSAAQTIAAFLSSGLGLKGSVAAAAQTVAAFVSAGSGKREHVAQAAQTIAAFTSQAEGQMGAAKVGSAAQAIANFVSAAAGKVGRVATAAQSLGLFSSTAAGKVGHIGSAAQTMANFRSSASGQMGDVEAPAGDAWLLRRRRRRRS